MLTYSARASLPYDGQEHSVSQWNRYHFAAYLGLVFFACGGLPSRRELSFMLDPSGSLTRGQVGALSLLIVILVGLQFPVSWIDISGPTMTRATNGRAAPYRRSRRRCQANRISAETARQALGFWRFLTARRPAPAIRHESMAGNGSAVAMIRRLMMISMKCAD